MTLDSDYRADMTPLRRTRSEFGWKVPRLIAALRRCAPQVGMTLGTDKSLKTTISRHENGRVIPGEEWRKLYRLVFGRTDEELGFATSAAASIALLPVEDLEHRLATARRVDMALVEEMRQQVHHIRLLDRRLGAPSLLEQTRSVMTTLTELGSYSLKPSIREGLAAVLSDAAALAAWQALDIGAIHQAWGHYETARRARSAVPPAVGPCHGRTGLRPPRSWTPHRRSEPRPGGLKAHPKERPKIAAVLAERRRGRDTGCPCR